MTFLSTNWRALLAAWVLIIFCVQRSSAFAPTRNGKSKYLQRIWILQVSEGRDTSDVKTFNQPREYKIRPNPRLSNTKRVVSHNSKDRYQFRQFLQQLSRRLKNPRTAANRLDDELKQMQINFYGLDPKKDESLQCRYPESVSYNGNFVEPDLACYTIVANAYAKANLGRTGAELAEQVLKRCEKYCQTQQPNTILKTCCRNAWLQAEDYEKADEWLENMESTFAKTREPKDAPDTITYTQILEGLSDSKTLSVQEITRRGDEIFNKMHRLKESGENPYVSPNSFTYIAAIKCQARRQATNSKDGAALLKEQEKLFRELQANYKATGDPNLRPNAMCYAAVSNIASRSNGGIQAARYTEALLRELEDEFNATCEPDLYPLDTMYTACLTAYARVEAKHAPEATERVRALLQKAEHVDRKHKPSVHVYTAAINGLTFDDNSENLKEAEAILRRLPEPDSVAYRCVIKAYARNGNAAKADELIWELYNMTTHDKTKHRGKSQLLPPDVITIASGINAWVNGHAGQVNEALDHAQRLLQLIIDAYKEGKVLPHHRQAEAWIFENVIRLWSLSKRSDAGEQAERLIEIMDDLAKTTKHFKPTFNTYIFTLHAWSASNRNDAPKRARALFERMELLSEEGELEAVDNRALSAVLVSTAKSKSSEEVRYSEDLFQRIVELYKAGDRSASVNSRTLTGVLSALSRSNERDAVDRAMNLLRQMRQLCDRGLKNFEPNTITYNSVLNLVAKSGLPERAEELVEEMEEMSSRGLDCACDVVTWSCLCRAYSKSNHPNAAERTLAILAAVEEKYSETNKLANMKPDSLLYNSVLTTLARAAKKDPTAADKADELLARMEMSIISNNLVQADVVSFGCVCQAHAVSGTKHGIRKAEEVLQRAENLAATGSMAVPDTIFYSALVLAFARSKAPGSLRKAEEIIHRMEELHLSGRRNMRPSFQTWNYLLSGWAHSRDNDKVEKSGALLEKMKAAKAVPDLDSYNWILLAAARTTRKSPEDAKRDFQIVLRYFREVHNESKHVIPNSYTYGYFLRACSALLPAGAERDKLMAKTFEICKQKGLVSKEVLAYSAELMPDILIANLRAEGVTNDFEVDNPKFSLLPLDWTRNRIRERRASSAALSIEGTYEKHL